VKLPDGGKLVAWTGFIFGTVVSVAANVLAARIPPTHAPEHWSPRLDTQLGSAVWPVALLLSIEALARIAWPKGFIWSLARFGGLTLVAAGAFVISYQHINHVLASWGYEWLSQGVGPLVIDGLMIICGVAMLSKPGTLKKLLVGKEAANYTEVGQPESETPAPEKVAQTFGIPQDLGVPKQDMTTLISEQRTEEFAALVGPVPAQRNGHRVSAALKSGPKAPARRKTSGQSDEEIAALLRAEVDRGENPDLTKRGVMNRFSVGAPRWTKITELLKKEES
jgi:hypothetical protein